MSMLKTIQWSLVLLFFSATLGSCLKDYPKDIPDWLKEKIKGFEKEKKSKSCCCIHSDCMDIQEYTNGTYTIFRLKSGGYSGPGYYFYTYDGERCLLDDEWNTDCDLIPNLEDYHFSRLVWEEEYEKPLF